MQSLTDVAPAHTRLPRGHGVHFSDERTSVKELNPHFSHWAPEPNLGISCCKQKWHSPFRISSTVENLYLLATSNWLHQAFPKSESSLESNQASNHTTCLVRTSPARSESKCWRGQNLASPKARTQILRDEWNSGRHSILWGRSFGARFSWLELSMPLCCAFFSLFHNTISWQTQYVKGVGWSPSEESSLVHVPLWFCRSHRRVAGARLIISQVSHLTLTC